MFEIKVGTDYDQIVFNTGLDTASGVSEINNIQVYSQNESEVTLSYDYTYISGQGDVEYRIIYENGTASSWTNASTSNITTSGQKTVQLNASFNPNSTFTVQFRIDGVYYEDSITFTTNADTPSVIYGIDVDESSITQTSASINYYYEDRGWSADAVQYRVTAEGSTPTSNWINATENSGQMNIINITGLSRNTTYTVEFRITETADSKSIYQNSNWVVTFTTLA